MVRIKLDIYGFISRNTSGGNRKGAVNVSVVTTGAVDRGFEPRSGQIEDYKIGICCFFAMQH